MIAKCEVYYSSLGYYIYIKIHVCVFVNVLYVVKKCVGLCVIFKVASE